MLKKLCFLLMFSLIVVTCAQENIGEVNISSFAAKRAVTQTVSKKEDVLKKAGKFSTKIEKTKMKGEGNKITATPFSETLKTQKVNLLNKSLVEDKQKNLNSPELIDIKKETAEESTGESLLEKDHSAATGEKNDENPPLLAKIEEDQQEVQEKNDAIANRNEEGESKIISTSKKDADIRNNLSREPYEKKNDLSIENEKVLTKNELTTIDEKALHANKQKKEILVLSKSEENDVLDDVNLSEKKSEKIVSIEDKESTREGLMEEKEMEAEGSSYTALEEVRWNSLRETDETLLRISSMLKDD